MIGLNVDHVEREPHKTVAAKLREEARAAHRDSRVLYSDWRAAGYDDDGLEARDYHHAEKVFDATLDALATLAEENEVRLSAAFSERGAA